MAAATINIADQGSKLTPDCIFTVGAGGVSNTVIGWALLVKDDAAVYYVEKIEKFPAGIVMTTIGDQILLDIAFLDQTGT
jgi:hypothetical protein